MAAGPEEQRQHLARRLKEWRAEEGLTQAEGAKRCGVSWRSFQDYERARALPHTAALSKLAKGTGIDWHDLIGVERRQGTDLLEEALEGMREEIRKLRTEVERLGRQG